MSRLTVIIVSGLVALTACNNKSGNKRSAPSGPRQGSVPPPGRYIPPVPPEDERVYQRTGEDEVIVGRHEEVRTRRVQPRPAPRTEFTYVDRERVDSPRPGAREDELRIRPGGDLSRRNRECGSAYRAQDPDWFPGLPFPPAKEPRVTGGVEQVNQDEVHYTDARNDALLNFAFSRTDRVTAPLKAASLDLALRIDNVNVFIDSERTGEVKMQFRYESVRQPGRFMDIKLRGQLGDREREGRRRGRSSGRMEAVLEQVAGQGVKFRALLVCADADMGCQNVVIRLQQHGRSGRVSRIAYVVHRWGPAHVSISERDRRERGGSENANHYEFARFLSNTAHNACVNLLDQVRRGRRTLPQCARERLEADCAGRRPRLPSAADFQLRTWAVAHGKAAFEFVALTNTRASLWDYEVRTPVAFSLAGPLVFSEKARPVWPRRLDSPRTSGEYSRYIHRAYLWANDGAGNLNLQIQFKGRPQSHTQINVTAIGEDVSTGERIARELEQTQDLSQQELAEREEPDDGAPSEK